MEKMNDVIPIEPNVFHVRRSKGFIHTVYSPDTFEDSKQYEELCHIFRSCTQNDSVIMYIRSFGGSCHAGQGLINAMADCQGFITCIVDQPSYSMGALLALSGHHLVMHTDTLLMFHNYSSATEGKGKELVDGVHRTEKWLRQQQEHCCYPFLTKGELKRLSNDNDVTIHYDDPTLQARIERHFKYQNKHRKAIRIE
jgi:ATP-dependent protease ClpP protease subunit